ncbi:F420-0--gamma-glutamyl ligase [cyanobiont of Ornithocercus magnificus]|nr:F420-0--gamma-glutamyl ligase [cyanobiont of Ornithocercus magnificus]
MSALLVILLSLGLLMLWIELRHRLRPHSPLVLSPRSAEVVRGERNLDLTVKFAIHNHHRRMEVMIPELWVKPTLLSDSRINRVKLRTSIKPNHPDEPARDDGYWPAYIVRGGQFTEIEVFIQLWTDSYQYPCQDIDGIWFDLHWVNYGPFGRLVKRDGVVVPLRYPDPPSNIGTKFCKAANCRILPIRTHLLGRLDNPLSILKHYAGNLIQPGDILIIGETPLAVMQGRYQHPAEIEPSCEARLLCRVFHPTSSLATACGLQALINIEGPSRILVAWVGGFLLRLAGVRGGFYRLAGSQAQLIDDVTGTVPPYDQTIVLGPRNTEEFCQRASSELGAYIAVADVNELGSVKLLATSSGCDKVLLCQALQSNPAGNANEQTPLVLVRPEATDQAAKIES